MVLICLDGLPAHSFAQSDIDRQIVSFRLFHFATLATILVIPSPITWWEHMGAGSVLFAFDLLGLYHIHGNQDLPATSLKMWQPHSTMPARWDLYHIFRIFRHMNFPEKLVQNGVMMTIWWRQGRTSHELLPGCSVSTRGSWMQWQQLQWQTIQRKQVWSVVGTFIVKVYTCVYTCIYVYIRVYIYI